MWLHISIQVNTQPDIAVRFKQIRNKLWIVMLVRKRNVSHLLSFVVIWSLPLIVCARSVSAGTGQSNEFTSLLQSRDCHNKSFVRMNGDWVFCRVHLRSGWKVQQGKLLPVRHNNSVSHTPHGQSHPSTLPASSPLPSADSGWDSWVSLGARLLANGGALSAA